MEIFDLDDGTLVMVGAYLDPFRLLLIISDSLRFLTFVIVVVVICPMGV